MQNVSAFCLYVSFDIYTQIVYYLVLEAGGIYPIYTCTLAMAEPRPSEVLFTLGELYPRQTSQPREDCLGEDLGEGQV